MESHEQSNLTTLLVSGDAAGEAPLSRVLPLVYDELRSMAANILRGERQNHTLQPTALVHEAYLRLVRQRNNHWHSRAHFFAAIAAVIRRILIDHARSRRRIKRGHGNRGVSLDEAQLVGEERAFDLLALDQALVELAEHDPRKAKVVELRVFGRLTAEQTAEVLGVSMRTVHYDWRMATAWLRNQLDRETGDGA